MRFVGRYRFSTRGMIALFFVWLVIWAALLGVLFLAHLVFAAVGR